MIISHLKWLAFRISSAMKEEAINMISEEEVVRQSKIRRVLIITLLLNILVAAIKFSVGHMFDFTSLVSSGIESFFDGSSNVLGLITMYYAAQPANNSHNYGHHKYETLGSLIIAFLLLFSSFQIFKSVWSHWQSSITPQFSWIPVVAITVSMAMSLYVSWYEGKVAKETHSSFLEADADHTFGDFIMSGGVLISILTSYFGWRWPDLMIGAGISVYLAYLAVKIIKENLPELMDASPGISESILSEVELMPEILDVHKFRARGNQRVVYIDFHILLEKNIPLHMAHDISHELEEKIKHMLKDRVQICDITIHVEPFAKNHHD